MSKAVKKVTKAVTSVVSKAVSSVSSAVSNVVKNPLPVIETVALTAITGNPAVSAAAVSAANGGSVKDIATSAATAYAGQQAGQSVGGQVAAATESKTLGSIAASATGASTQATLTGLAQGKSLTDALALGSKAFVAAGFTQAGIEQISPTTGPAPVEERSTGGTLGTTGDTGLTTAQEFPAGMSAAESLDKSQSYVPLPTEQKLLASALYPAVYSTLFGQSTQPSTTVRAPTTSTTPAPTQQVSPTQTTISPGTQALAQALRVGDVGAPIFGGDKEEGRKAGWNVESLRYMGDTGEA